MHLITCKEFLARRNGVIPKFDVKHRDKLVTYAFFGDVMDGLKLLKDYERAYKDKFFNSETQHGMVLEYTLVSTQQIEAVDSEAVRETLQDLNVLILDNKMFERITHVRV